MPKAAHHRGTHQARARVIKAQADANPSTRCWSCGLTLAEHAPHRDGRPAFWTAGHLNDGQVDGPMAPEASTCNYSRGAKVGNARRHADKHDLHPVRQW